MSIRRSESRRDPSHDRKRREDRDISVDREKRRRDRSEDRDRPRKNRDRRFVSSIHSMKTSFKICSENREKRRDRDQSEDRDGKERRRRRRSVSRSSRAEKITVNNGQLTYVQVQKA